MHELPARCPGRLNIKIPDDFSNRQILRASNLLRLNAGPFEILRPSGWPTPGRHIPSPVFVHRPATRHRGCPAAGIALAPLPTGASPHRVRSKHSNRGLQTDIGYSTYPVTPSHCPCPGSRSRRNEYRPYLSLARQLPLVTMTPF